MKKNKDRDLDSMVDEPLHPVLVLALLALEIGGLSILGLIILPALIVFIGGL